MRVVAQTEIAIATASELEQPGRLHCGVTRAERKAAARSDGHGRQASAKRHASIVSSPSSRRVTSRVPPKAALDHLASARARGFPALVRRACRRLASRWEAADVRIAGRRRGATRTPLRDLSPHRSGQSRRRARFDRCARPDRRGVSGACVLGHRDLHAAVLRVHRSTGGAVSAHVPLPHARCGAAQSQGSTAMRVPSMRGNRPIPVMR